MFVDTEWWLRVADAERRELYLSVGCALENLLVVAEQFGFVYEVEYFPTDDDDSLGARVRVGQTFERLALRATLTGLCVHSTSQVLCLPDLRAESTDALDVEAGHGVVQHHCRLGRADPERGRSSRRLLADVLD